MPSPSIPHIEICIATYKRPESLLLTLKSLAPQISNQLFSFGITVVDNDCLFSAHSIVTDFASHCSILVKYLTVAEKNISLARNAGLEASEADFIATIDDDEVAKVDWLLKAYTILTELKADMVHAPNHLIYPSNASFHFRFYRPHSLPNPPTGSKTGYVLSSANSLFKTWGLKKLTPPFFDPRFGICGGEDVDFFLRLRDLGYLGVWCQEAIVYEKLPLSRCTLGWLTIRSFRTGTTACKRHLKRQIKLTRNEVFKCLSRILRGAILASRLRFRYNQLFFKNWNDLFFNLGFFLHYLTGIIYNEYSNGKIRFRIDKYRYLRCHLQKAITT